MTIMTEDKINPEMVVEKTLLVRHLPVTLSDVEKEELLFHFGASRVKVMSIKGPMKHTAFATFIDQDTAEKALKRLHQLDVLGCRLSVEFARSTQQKHFPSLLDGKSRKEGVSKQTAENAKEEVDMVEEKEDLPSRDDVFKRWSVDYPRNPRIHYRYPTPSVSILTNIANALAAYPKFYIQVLHLMNKMNLPAPFSHVTPTPPIRVDDPVIPKPPVVMETEQNSTEESEIESEGEAEKFVSETPTLKRPHPHKPKMPRKKMKLIHQIPMPQLPSNAPVLTPSEVFEEMQHPIQKKIQLKLPGPVSEEPQTELQKLGVFLEQAPPDLLSVVEPESHPSSVTPGGGFGVIEPVEKPSEKPETMESSVNYTVDPSNFILREDLRKGRISEREMKNFTVFKNYQSGDPTSRLYIKNLAKTTTEQDLLNIFGQYVDWESEMDKNMFDIRLMKEGRMKGQAFITLPNDELARKAVRDSNSYVLHGKPMVVQFARSAKAKETPDGKPGKQNR